MSLTGQSLSEEMNKAEKSYETEVPTSVVIATSEFATFIVSKPQILKVSSYWSNFPESVDALTKTVAAGVGHFNLTFRIAVAGELEFSISKIVSVAE